MYVTLFLEESAQDTHIVFLPQSGYGLNEWEFGKEGNHELRFYIKDTTYSGYVDKFYTINQFIQGLERKTVNSNFGLMSVVTPQYTYQTAVKSAAIELDNTFPMGEYWSGTLEAKLTLETNKEFTFTTVTGAVSVKNDPYPFSIDYGTATSNDATHTIIRKNDNLVNATASGVVFIVGNSQDPATSFTPISYASVSGGTPTDPGVTKVAAGHVGAYTGYVLRVVPQSDQWTQGIDSGTFFNGPGFGNIFLGHYSTIHCYAKLQCSGEYSFRLAYGIDEDNPYIFSQENYVSTCGKSVQYLGSLQYKSINDSITFPPRIEYRAITGSGVGFIEIESYVYVGTNVNTSSIIEDVQLRDVKSGSNTTNVLEISANFLTDYPEISSYIDASDDLSTSARGVGEYDIRIREREVLYMPYMTAMVSGVSLWNQWTTSGVYTSYWLEYNRQELTPYPV